MLNTISNLVSQLRNLQKPGPLALATALTFLSVEASAQCHNNPNVAYIGWDNVAWRAERSGTGFRHTPAAGGGSHTSPIINYKDAGGANRTVQWGSGSTFVITGMFGERTSFDYRTWDNAPWTASWDLRLSQFFHCRVGSAGQLGSFVTSQAGCGRTQPELRVAGGLFMRGRTFTVAAEGLPIQVVAGLSVLSLNLFPRPTPYTHAVNMPGCSLYVDPVLALPCRSNIPGQVLADLPLPVFDVTFIGTPFFMQLIIVDTGLSTPWQVSLSNLGTAILGS